MNKMHLMPVTLGAMMAPMMLWMLHGQITGTAGTTGTLAALVFIGAHLVIIAATVTLALFTARMSPALHALFSRIHRPNSKHLGFMLVGMALGAATTHLIAHGGIA